MTFSVSQLAAVMEDIRRLETFADERDHLLVRIGEVRTVAREMREALRFINRGESNTAQVSASLNNWANRLDPEQVGTPDTDRARLCRLEDISYGGAFRYRSQWHIKIKPRGDGQNCVLVDGEHAGLLGFMGNDTEVEPAKQTYETMPRLRG